MTMMMKDTNKMLHLIYCYLNGESDEMEEEEEEIYDYHHHN